MAAFFPELLRMSFLGSLMILLILPLRALLKKSRGRMICLLWGAAALRLALPLSVSSSLSAIPEVLIGAVRDEAGRKTADSEGNETGKTKDSKTEDGSSVRTELISYQRPEDPSVIGKAYKIGKLNVSENLLRKTGIIWFSGTLVFFAAVVLQQVRLKKFCKRAVRDPKGIWFAEGLPSACIAGILHPRILVPYETPDEDLPYIIAHEKMHLNFRDHRWKAAGVVILGLHWLNPLVWAAYCLFSRDLEYGCDEAVTRYYSREKRAGYARALLNAGSGRNLLFSAPPAFGAFRTDRRIRNVFFLRDTSGWLRLLCLLFTVLLLTGGFTAYQEYREPAEAFYYYSDEEWDRIIAEFRELESSTGELYERSETREDPVEGELVSHIEEGIREENVVLISLKVDGDQIEVTSRGKPQGGSQGEPAAGMRKTRLYLYYKKDSGTFVRSRTLVSFNHNGTDTLTAVFPDDASELVGVMAVTDQIFRIAAKDPDSFPEEEAWFGQRRTCYLGAVEKQG
ncbi:MAG: M56 family metallopeptidase [Lachnospiraceae bacterium]|nr:M56 family metallopeptidase [Lachnospiraceae bacterium]